MRPLFLTLTSILFFQLVSAQAPSSVSHRLSTHTQLLNNLLQPQANTVSSANKTNATISYRVVSQGTHNNTDSSMVDSVKVTYGAYNTSTYDYNTMVYNYNYPYNTSPMFNFQGVFTTPQIQFSTYKHWQIDPNTLLYGFYQSENAGYDASKNMIRDTAKFADSLVLPNMLYWNNFNASNKIVSSFSFMNNGGVIDSAFKQFFVYDASNKLTKDSMYEYHGGAWHVVSRTFYTYDASNNLTVIDQFANVSDTTFMLPLVKRLQYANSYDASNRLINVMTSFNDDSLFRPFVKDTFEYTGASTFHTSWRQHQYDAINLRWEPMSRMTKQLNVNGLPDTIYVEGFNRIASLWTPGAMWICRYDTAKNPIKLLDFEYNFVSFPARPNFSTYYFYESYENEVNHTAIRPIVQAENSITLFPNPATTNISIEGLATQQKTVKVSIADMQGRLYRQQDIVVNGNTATFSMADFMPGTYTIVLVDNAGKVLHQQILIKQ
jgi:hypothetical protein